MGMACLKRLVVLKRLVIIQKFAFFFICKMINSKYIKSGSNCKSCKYSTLVLQIFYQNASLAKCILIATAL